MYIFIFFIILIIFIIIYLTYIYYNNNNNDIHFTEINDNCLYKRFGCCGDRLTPRLDQDGTNCRGF